MHIESEMHFLLNCIENIGLFFWLGGDFGLGLAFLCLPRTYSRVAWARGMGEERDVVMGGGAHCSMCLFQKSVSVDRTP